MSVFHQLTQLSDRFLKRRIAILNRRPVGVSRVRSVLTFFSQLSTTPAIQLATGQDNYSFTSETKNWLLPPLFDGQQLQNVQLIQHDKTEFVFFQAKTGQSSLHSYMGELVGNHFSEVREISPVQETAVILSDDRLGGKTLLFYGDRSIRLATSQNIIDWQSSEVPLIIDSVPTQAAGVSITDQGILLLYYRKFISKNKLYYSAHLALLDSHDPKKLIWKMTDPIWEQEKVWPDKEAFPISAIFDENHFVSYWWVDQKMTIAIKHTGFKLENKQITSHKKIALQKHSSNPLIKPDQTHDWESFTTFNPSALYLNDQVHILYRAQGYDYVSSIGYAVSDDGVEISKQFNKPIYAPTSDFEINDSGEVNPHFMSGGGYGGCEDPRLTMIDNTVYMIYVAFDGWSPPRLAMTSLSLENFLKQNWIWSKPVLISPPGIVDKSGCLFPEKIDGKYVFLHRVFPNILIDFVDDLNFDGNSHWLIGQSSIKLRPQYWDSRKIGAGAPPLRTKDGWLLIYYGVDDKDAGKYHVGAMLLDLEDPSKVLFRSNQPILKPEEKYEWEGFKPGVAYPCGAVIIKDRLLVYYGAADSVVCVATAHLDTFLADLKSQTTISWESFPVKEA